ncbi:hypothetical protein GCK32_006851 [Trichostrongylus colubriformis]|uniref:FZ domain-containing protein n=1 Tax=Trichostrongylus colubriformis TaxID=6319 RepID=A0AAN8FMX6_TRICO
MWLLLPLLILAPEDLNAVITEYEEIEDDLASPENYTYNESDAEIHSVQSLRRNPDPDDNCFGIPITYKYSRDFHVQRFPRELAVLNRYPKCWSHLAPLICATIYRPCSRHFFIEMDNNGEVKNGTIELWQLLSASQCESVHRVCGAVVSSHLLFTYTQCEDPKRSRLAVTTKSNRPLYSTSCQFASDQLPVPVKSGICAWPLVSTQSHFIHHDSSPVIDECFLPCR